MDDVKGGLSAIAKLAPIAVSFVLVSACEPEDDTQQTARVTERVQGTQDLDRAFAEPPGEGIAIVNGSQAASIQIEMPEDMDQFSQALREELERRANSGTEAFIAAAESDQQMAAEKGFEYSPHSLDVKWMQTGPQEGRLRGLLGTYATYTGGAHSNVGFDVLNWDIEADEQVAFEDIFEDAAAARANIAMVLKRKLLVAKRERLEDRTSSDADILQTWVDPAFDGNISVFDHFSISRSTEAGKAGGLIYHFAPYEVGAYAEGIYVIGVDQEEFRSDLKATYADAFGGEAILP
ncbi:MAG: DUF4163 domain-containing protein [Henriciella sp.]|uniref:DUF3298 and DUF4163 domain-containing protein n=1 Tax=Henriciella sp. TaxID=1968823 RepID=UPI003C72B50E